MKALTTALAALAIIMVVSPAYATSIPTHSRHVEYRVVEPCDVEVASGEATLEWADCGGDVVEVKIDLPGYPHPAGIVFYAGSPDWSKIDECCYDMLFCTMHCTKKHHDVYCMDCDPCCWYCYKKDICWCGETVCVRAVLPSCMSLEILDVY